ncbi:GNAT family N-acetyltransferase [Reyranella sp.]|uniref:GNAT family N-acetyltransferase n=1 Tax=Reyranella sp. TaxID=1929291 RepID=UPI003BAAF26E
MTEQTATGLGNRPEITIKLASTSDEMMQCFMLRAAVFMGEQQCPYWEEYDGNDYTASHLILYVDGEPAASIRVRWFAGFAKLERAIILKRYRSYGLFLPFVHWAKEFCRKKGYPKAYLHGQRRLWPIFEKDGFRKVDDKIFHFSDHEYGAFACDLDVSEDAPTVLTDPMVLNRPEDQLDTPGVLEESMERGASNPHAGWTERRTS